MIVSSKFNQILPMLSAKVMRWKRLCVHQICIAVYLPLQQWTTLTTTQALQQQRILFTELVYLSCNINHSHSVAISVAHSRSSTRSVSFLPSAYTSILPAAIKIKQFTAPRFQGLVTPANLVTASSAVAEEYDWLNAVVNALKKGNLSKNEWVSWSAYHASIQTTEIPPADINALLPSFIENAHSVAMIKQSMGIVKTSVQYLNPGPIPVLAADKLLFALSKQIQWTWPATHREDQFVIMFGAVLKVSHVYVTLYQINLSLSTV